MQRALLIRLRPSGPWRYGPGEGGLDRLDALFRSDRLYSAVTLAMRQLGWLEEWLAATAQASPSLVAFSSLFPFQGDSLYAIPPVTLWPPPAAFVTTPSPLFLSRIRWKTARFVPLSVIDSLITGQQILADQWLPDPDSACLLRRDRPSTSPFRPLIRSVSGVDRVSNTSFHAEAAACVQFGSGAGLWSAVRFTNDEGESVWSDRIQAAFRLLADTGLGGRRANGYGQMGAPEFQRGPWPDVILPKLARALRQRNGNSTQNGAQQYWFLSLYSPSPDDRIMWSEGSYQLTMRGGYVENSTASGMQKKAARLITEGSVIAAGAEPRGVAVDVAPAGFGHAVYRSGIALALNLPAIEPQSEPSMIEEPTAMEEIQPVPCEQPAPTSTPEYSGPEGSIPEDSVEDRGESEGIER
jgi:CRISPR type III-A-associated RAMP protein Csm4